MKKNLRFLALLTLLVLALSAVSFAASDNEVSTTQQNADAYARFKERIEWKRTQIEQAVKDGKITKEQAQKWYEHFDYMDKWHQENGFLSDFCQGTCDGTGRFGKGMRNGKGFGRGNGRVNCPYQNSIGK